MGLRLWTIIMKNGSLRKSYFFHSSQLDWGLQLPSLYVLSASWENEGPTFFFECSFTSLSLWHLKGNGHFKNGILTKVKSDLKLWTIAIPRKSSFLLSASGRDIWDIKLYQQTKKLKRVQKIIICFGNFYVVIYLLPERKRRKNMMCLRRLEGM